MGRATARVIFTTLRGGMQQLVDALTARLEPRSVGCHPVKRIGKDIAGWKVRLRGEDARVLRRGDYRVAGVGRCRAAGAR